MLLRISICRKPQAYLEKIFVSGESKSRALFFSSGTHGAQDSQLLASAKGLAESVNVERPEMWSFKTTDQG